MSDQYPDRSCAARLRLDPTAPATARRMLADLVGPHDRLDDLLLATSEVVTNAVLYGGPSAVDASLRAEFDERTVRVSVRHHGPGFRFHADPAFDPAGGRGLAILSRLASRWGVEGGGMAEVWFEFTLEPGESTDGSAATRSPSRRRHHDRSSEVGRG